MTCQWMLINAYNEQIEELKQQPQTDDITRQIQEIKQKIEQIEEQDREFHARQNELRRPQGGPFLFS